MKKVQPNVNKIPFCRLEEDSRFIKLSEGNKKLVPNKKVKFLIFNLPSKITCPYATEHCKFYCYAVEPENQYPDCLPSRLKHLEETKEDDFAERMIFTINAHLGRPSYKTAETIIIRIHESGDFYNRNYLMKWLQIAEHFKGEKKIVFMAYTKSVRFFVGLDIPDNMIVRYSIWDDTKAEELEIAESLELPTYSAVDEFTNEPIINRCFCFDCAECGKCWDHKIQWLVCINHSNKKGVSI